jgi:asparagine synthase (glutamine-hydrolysing)
MSGFVGLLHRDGQPVDANPLRALAEALAYRGPDGVRTWNSGTIGFGHARFVTHPARDGALLPLALDGRLWLTGDLRLDARDELIDALRAAEGSDEARGLQDAALVLRAYRAWGPACVQRIHGDFSFALWDEPARRLFCARDRFGVRPFFYAPLRDALVFGNTLDTLLRHPGVGTTPYEPALADYLVVGNLLEADRTFFADVRRLPPGHSLTVEHDGEPRVTRYWDLPVEAELRHARDADYVDQFAELLSRAIADRAPPGRVALFMSGGLDSASIAAVLAGKLGVPPGGVEARATCLGWNGVFADPEPALARRCAAALGIGLDVHEFDDAEPFRGWDTAEGAGPEPEDDAYRNHSLTGLRLAAAQSRVVLTGRGGNEILATEFLIDELRRAPGWRPLAGALSYCSAGGRRPPLGLRAMLAPALPDWLRIPGWLDARWLARFDMPQRLRAFDPPPQGRRRPPHARARARLGWHRSFTGFEFADAGATRVPVDSRYPFADERLVRFALRLPALPWCVDKHLERRALEGRCPDEIVRRPKAVLAADPFATWLGLQPTVPASWVERVTSLGGRVDPRAWSQAWGGVKPDAAWRLARASALARWLEVTAGAYAPPRAVA